MSFEQVKEFFLAAGAADRLLELPQSSATVELAAKAIGCRPERIAKTLSFLVGGRPVLIVAAGDARIDNRKFRSEFQENASSGAGRSADRTCAWRSMPVCGQRKHGDLS